MWTYALAIVLGMAVAAWTWRARLQQPIGLAAAAARGVGLTALLLLLLDPGIVSRIRAVRPLVLLDNSISMHAATGHAADAAALAGSLGDTIHFADLAPGQPGGRSELGDALASAVAAGRPVVVVTDGEISDGLSLPADLVAQATIRIVPRSAAPDIGLVDISAPLRMVVGDTLRVEVDGIRTAGSPDTAAVVVSDSATPLMRGVLRFGNATHARLRLAGVLPHGMQGERWLRIAREGAPDSEPGDDVRWWRMIVMPTPGIVVIVARADWDGRALFRALHDVADAPVRGFVQLQPGLWRRMEDLRAVTAADVMAAARAADLLAVRGDPQPWRLLGRARLLWPEGVQPGDWYLSGATASPVNGAFAGIALDSLPAGLAVASGQPTPLHDWVGAEARLSRRGLAIPVIWGRDDHGRREVTIGIDGLGRWSLRGGLADQAWRTLMADATSWLLAGPEGDSTLAKPIATIVQRGRPVQFRWSGAGGPRALVLQLHSDAARVDTLRFDGEGVGALELPVGRYRYTINGGGRGAFAVEPFSDELLPAPVTLRAHDGIMSQRVPRRSLRSLAWLFALAVAGFAGEWMLRRRMGVR